MQTPQLTDLEQARLANLRLDRALQQTRLALAGEMNLSARLSLQVIDQAETALMDAAVARPAPAQGGSGGQVLTVVGDAA